MLVTDPHITPASPRDAQPTIGLIGMGAMGKMYAKYLSGAGWLKCVTSIPLPSLRYAWLTLIACLFSPILQNQCLRHPVQVRSVEEGLRE